MIIINLLLFAGATLECLIEKLVALYQKSNDEKAAEAEIGEQCRHQIMRLAELQVNNSAIQLID